LLLLHHLHVLVACLRLGLTELAMLVECHVCAQQLHRLNTGNDAPCVPVHFVVADWHSNHGLLLRHPAAILLTGDSLVSLTAHNHLHISFVLAETHHGRVQLMVLAVRLQVGVLLLKVLEYGLDLQSLLQVVERGVLEA